MGETVLLALAPDVSNRAQYDCLIVCVSARACKLHARAWPPTVCEAKSLGCRCTGPQIHGRNEDERVHSTEYDCLSNVLYCWSYGKSEITPSVRPRNFK